MKHRSVLIALSFATAFALTSASYASGSAEEFWVYGLKVILKPNPANEIISAQLYLRGGVLNLGESTQGIEPLIFRSAVKGSKNYSKDELNEILDRTAATINSSSNQDYTSVNLRCIRQYFDETWDVFADVIVNPTFDPAEVELVRENMLVSIRQRKDNPDVYLRDLLDELFYQGHPYELKAGGVETSVSGITIDQMRNHLIKNLRKSQMLLIVVGNVDKEDLQKKVASAFGKLPAGSYEPVYPEAVEHKVANLKVVERELPTNYIIGCVSAPSLSHPDFYPMTMAMNILRTRVWEEVRTKRSLSYAPRAFYSNRFSNQAGIYVTAVQPDTTIKVMMAEVEKMQSEPVSAKDLADRTMMYLTRYFMGNETNAAQSRFLARFELSGRGWKESEDLVENLRKVTAQDVQRVVNSYFHDIQFAVLGNPILIDEELFTSK